MNVTRGGAIYLQSEGLRTDIGSIVATWEDQLAPTFMVGINHDTRPLISVNLIDIGTDYSLYLWFTAKSTGYGEWDGSKTHSWVAL